MQNLPFHRYLHNQDVLEYVAEWLHGAMITSELLNSAGTWERESRRSQLLPLYEWDRVQITGC